MHNLGFDRRPTGLQRWREWWKLLPRSLIALLAPPQLALRCSQQDRPSPCRDVPGALGRLLHDLEVCRLHSEPDHGVFLLAFWFGWPAPLSLLHHALTVAQKKMVRKAEFPCAPVFSVLH